MAKIPVNLIVDVAKKHGPKAINNLKDNKELVAIVAPLVGAAAAKLKKLYDDRKIAFAEKEHHRKKRYSEYKNEILGNLPDLNRLQLVNHKDEVESFISQIEYEEKEEVALKKPLHSKRRDDWKKILIQIEDKIRLMDYQEYLKFFNNLTYTSSYFEGYDRKLNAYKNLISEESIKEIHEFIFEQTGKSTEAIQRDFV
ncbi:hypothetical protein [Planococcus halotolerans]|uniref:Uncharacterized protein n=1 Tax=Planococcus halotolerans TaxID=2233542 RepID=A0A365KX40_9BACL|nr:hypothetical protein [Planococcus halotolerans]QHJ72268.1 hypothetical protein DNR44_017400 [Planococcus halotolerans]RAZ77710.1 hypothetical protein DP120_09515 [Planococcus halotolerans]